MTPANHVRSLARTVFYFAAVVAVTKTNSFRDDAQENSQYSSIKARKLFKNTQTFNDYSTNLISITPEQVHLSWNGKSGQMSITWNTAQLDDGAHTIVKWGNVSNRLDQVTTGTVNKFVDGGNLKRVQYIHTVTLQGLNVNGSEMHYFYRVGSHRILSNITYKFRALPAPSDMTWQPRLLIVADMGTENSRALIDMTKEAVQQNLFDLIVHNGDIAYDMADMNGQNGDAFMRLIEPLAAFVPYQTTVGNHEHQYNFSHYTNRFVMPGDAHGLFYSMDLGPLHFVVVSTEFYYFPKYGVEQILRQYQWLESNLKSVRESNKGQWIVVAGHRPVYCSAWDPLGCNPWGSILRSGIELIGIPGLEELFFRYGVDLYIGAHEHIYERTWPVYNTSVMNGTHIADRPYVDSMATVYIVNGAGGNRQGQDSFYAHAFPYSAYRSRDYGFGRLKVYNTTHLHVEQVGIEAGGVVIDEMWMVKTEPTPAWLRPN